ncbi:hypothetical protein [Microcystis phage Mel-JY01]
MEVCPHAHLCVPGNVTVIFAVASTSIINGLFPIADSLENESAKFTPLEIVTAFPLFQFIEFEVPLFVQENASREVGEVPLLPLVPDVPTALVPELPEEPLVPEEPFTPGGPVTLVPELPEEPLVPEEPCARRTRG